MRLTAKLLANFSTFLGYGEEIETLDMLTFVIEGAVPRTFPLTARSVLTSEGDLSAVWKGQHFSHYEPSEEALLRPVPSLVDEHNDTYGFLLLNQSPVASLSKTESGEKFYPSFYASLGNGNSGSTGRDSGWPQILPGMHLGWESSTYKSGKACLRGNPWAYRESPSGEYGGDGSLTLTEIINNGIEQNSSLLQHPMFSSPKVASQGCAGPAGNRKSDQWKVVYRTATVSSAIGFLYFHYGTLSHWIGNGSPMTGPEGSYRPFFFLGMVGSVWTHYLQSLLGVTVDGIPGPETALAFQQWRRSRGYTNDSPFISPKEWIILEANYK